MHSIYHDIYRSPSRLRKEDGGRRIYAPVAYSLVRTMQLVPIVHVEAMPLAAWFPICWRKTTDGTALVALRSLAPDGSGHPAGAGSRFNSLPLLLRAYPFVACPQLTEQNDDAGEPLIEDVTADRVTDIGAPILLPDGRPSRGATARLQAVSQFRSLYRETVDISTYLANHDLFEPWPLEFDIEGRSIAVNDLLIIRQNAFGTPKIAALMAQFGAAGAMLVGAHRISLFRAGGLVQTMQRTRIKNNPAN